MKFYDTFSLSPSTLAAHCMLLARLSRTAPPPTERLRQKNKQLGKTKIPLHKKQQYLQTLRGGPHRENKKNIGKTNKSSEKTINIGKKHQKAWGWGR